MKGLLLFGFLGIVQAFKNTAPLIVSGPHFNADFEYLIPSSRLAEVTELTETTCTSRPQENIIYLQVEGLSKRNLDRDLLSNLPDPAIVAPHVLYNSAEEVSLAVSSKCKSTTVDVRADDWLDQIGGQGVFVIRLDVSELPVLETILIGANPKTVIIQGVPRFQNTISFLGQAKNYVKKISQYTKRSDAVDESDYAAIQEELNEAFDEINQMIGDETATIYEPEQENVNYNTGNSARSSSVVDGSLFDKYGFFTPGLVMCTFVSLFLFFIFSIALKWLNSLQVSYKAFEKPVTFGKKTQ
ncbi:hypothetical protein KL935_004171 [Ogataea polymorpha]|nr:hypothetical protein KL908_004606 [Ogataea polymorpha]KAG7898572.1 hypothetical protein KL935_004171 [Ogataea polymorpha]KAG7901539.1 hypothetical protein KL907_004209 [Ogataea polymorpha]KAG7907034.1 hypothetical protein KL906_004220 [Ogataea polymorpha]